MSFRTTYKSWTMNWNCQEWHNTTLKDKVERIALRNARWRILELLRKESRWTLREGIKSLMNHHVEPPWRTPINKRIMKRKRSWKHKVKPCDDLNGASWWHTRESLELREKKRWNKWNEEFWWTSGIRNWIYSMKQE